MVLTALLFQIPVGVGREVQQFTQSEFFIYVIPFLFAFAIIYGLLGHVEIPKDKQIRATISVLLSMLLLPAAPTVMGFLQPVTGSLMILVGGILTFIILMELIDIGSTGISDPESEGGHKPPFYERHGNTMAIILITIAAIIFANAGGLELLGIGTPSVFLNAPLLFFLVVVLLVVWFVSLKD